MESERISEFVRKMLSDCNETKTQDNLIIRQATGKPEGTHLTCADIIEHIRNTKDASVYLSGLKILVLLLFGGKKNIEENPIQIVAKLITEGFEKNLLS
ncbi:uncharacterized protein METZ01_LOCUS370681 [marine metagenome]|uniref:Uncharacterized protein n=1 Tax=marine metagenome TaxID=408172 RepID=A0A382T8K0_9ZZZZ